MPDRDGLRIDGRHRREWHNRARFTDVVVLEQTSEANARQIFADRVRVAGALGYESVTLRHNNVDIERWPSRG